MPRKIIIRNRLGAGNRVGHGSSFRERGLMTSLLKIQLLGDFLLVQQNQRETVPVPIEAGRLQSLLAYLVLHSRAPQSRQHLAFLFWPDTTDSQARTNLRNLLHRLRRVLPGADAFLRADSTLVQWLPEAPFTCDALTFEAAVTAAETRLKDGHPQQAETELRRAAALYGGDLLPGCYEEWISAHRERLRQFFFRALEMLTQLLEERRAYDDAIRYGQRWLNHDNLSESAYRRLMRLHALKGDRAGALHVFHACTTALERELGVEPDPATRSLYRRLLQGETVAPPRRGGVLHLPLVGRGTPWNRLVTTWKAIRHGQSPPQAVLVIGETGIGKTRLAEEFAEWVHRQGFLTAVGHCYTGEGTLPYAPVTTWLQHLPLTSLKDAWRVEIARLLPDVLEEHPGPQLPGPLQESWQRQPFFEALARTVLAQRQPLLLLLDDAHWADRGTLEWLHYLMRFDTQARLLLLLTARNGNGRNGHPLLTLTRSLQGRGQLVTVPLARLDSSQTAELAAHLVGHALPEETATALHRHTEGNPLFVVESVNSGLEYLHQPDAPLPERVRDVLAKRLRQVSPEARGLAETAAVIGRTFTSDVLTAVAGLEEARLVRALDELWQKRILREQEPATYAFSHDKLWQVTYARLSPVRRERLHRRVAEALAAGDAANPRPQAVHWEQAGERQQAARLYAEAARQSIARLAYDAARSDLEHALALLPEGPDALHAEIWFLLSKVYDVLGLVEHQQAAVDRLLLVCAQCEAPALQAQAQYQAGVLKTKTGQHVEAAVFFQRALELSRAQGQRELELDTLLACADLAIRTGEYPKARERFEEGLALAKSLRLPHREAEALDGLGFIFPTLGEPFSKSEAFLRQAVALRHACGDQLGEAKSLLNLTSLLQSRGALDKTIRLGEEALALSEEIGFRRGTAIAHSTLGLAVSMLGNLEKVERHLRTAGQIFSELDDVAGVTIATANLGLALERQGELDAAAASYEEALSLAVAHDTSLFEAIIRHDMGRIHLKEERWEAALESLGPAEDYFVRTGDPLYTASCQVLRARALLALDRRPESEELAGHNWQVWQEQAPEGELLPDFLWHFAALLKALGHPERAAQALRAAYAWLQTQADFIEDARMREAFFERVQVHRLIREACAAL